MLESDFDGQVDKLAALAEPGVRRALYRFVISRAPDDVSRDEAARALGIPRALAAFHLDRLVRSGLLEAVYRRLSGRAGPGAGRPAKLYRRAPGQVAVALPPRRYDLVAMITVQALAEHPSGATLEQVCSVAHRVGQDLGLRARGQEDAEAPMEMVRRALGEHGFEPTVDREGTLRLRNCPFAALTPAFRDTICAINLALHRGMLEGLDTPSLGASLAPDPHRCCVAIEPATSS